MSSKTCNEQGDSLEFDEWDVDHDDYCYWSSIWRYIEFPGGMSWEILRRPRFGKFGQKFARENCLDSIHDVVQVASKASSKFKAILVKDYITGERHVDWFIFSTFLDQFFRIPTSLKIKRYHQFRFSSEKPGFVFVWQLSQVLKRNITS